MRNVLEQVLEWNKVAQAAFRVLVLCDGDVAYLLFREHELEIIIHHDVLAPEAAEVFRNDAVDLAGIHICHHSFERWALEVRSAPAVVDILIHNVQAVFGGIFAQNCSLCLNAHAVAVALIVTAEAHIHCCVVNFRLLQIYLLCAKQPALTEPLYRKRGLHATI